MPRQLLTSPLAAAIQTTLNHQLLLKTFKANYIKPNVERGGFADPDHRSDEEETVAKHMRGYHETICEKAEQEQQRLSEEERATSEQLLRRVEALRAVQATGDISKDCEAYLRAASDDGEIDFEGLPEGMAEALENGNERALSRFFFYRTPLGDGVMREAGAERFLDMKIYQRAYYEALSEASGRISDRYKEKRRAEHPMSEEDRAAWDALDALGKRLLRELPANYLQTAEDFPRSPKMMKNMQSLRKALPVRLVNDWPR